VAHTCTVKCELLLLEVRKKEPNIRVASDIVKGQGGDRFCVKCCFHLQSERAELGKSVVAYKKEWTRTGL
jgi:hypothetical protein